MAKYNIMILERINKDNLIVEANRLNKKQPPTGGSGGHGGTGTGPKEPRLTPFQKMVLERFDRIESRLGNVEQRLGNVEKVLENHSGILERNNLH